ncbi:MAG: hypothetical protein NTV28_09290 [Propionibacteriales bacterium]|nr:hypothetical protein [Propionibacteriales bacterium]
MSESTALATIRLSVVGDAGRVDLAVPRWADVGAVAAGFRDQTGSGPVLLSTATGRALDPTTSVHAARLEHGDLLVAVDADAAPVSTAPTGRGSRSRRASSTAQHTAPVVLAPPTERTATGAVIARLAPGAVAVAGLLAATAGATTGGAAADAASGALALVVLAVAGIVGLRVPAGAHDRAWLAVVPLLLAAAVVLQLPASQPGGTTLAVTVAGLAVACGSAALRAAVPGVADEELAVQLVAGIGVALLATVSLLSDWSTTTLAALVLLAAVLGARLLPSFVVDVPDHVLVDLQRLAVTAWTAREQPRRSFRGVVREDDVRAVALRALRLVGAATVVCSLLVAASGAWLLLAPTDGARDVGATLVCAATGAALVLSGRTLRATQARRWQRTTGTALLLATAASLLLEVGDDARVAGATAAVLLGLVLALVARSAGRGWTSVWWSRSAEIAEGLAFVAVVGAFPLVSGLFDWMRVLTSS